MDAKQYCEVISVYQRYFELFDKKRGGLKTNFNHGRIALENQKFTDDGPTYVIRSKHGILCEATPCNSNPEHWSKNGTFIGRTVVSPWMNHNSLILNNSIDCKYQHEFVVGNGYTGNSEIYDELLDAQCIEDVEGMVFQQSMISDFSEEYGIACLHKAGLLLRGLVTFNLRLTSHLGSTDDTVIGLMGELKEYMKYVR